MDHQATHYEFLDQTNKQDINKKLTKINQTHKLRQKIEN